MLIIYVKNLSIDEASCTVKERATAEKVDEVIEFMYYIKKNM